MKETTQRVLMQSRTVREFIKATYDQVRIPVRGFEHADIRHVHTRVARHCRICGFDTIERGRRAELRRSAIVADTVELEKRRNVARRRLRIARSDFTGIRAVEH